MIKKNWKAKFIKLSQTRGADPLKMEIAPYRDWGILVIIFSIGLAISLAFNVYMSIEINRDSFFTITTKPVDTVKFNQEGLSQAIIKIDEKAALFEKAKVEVPPIVDPSL